MTTKGLAPARAIVPCIFIAALGCLVVPLPEWALDLFLISNLLFALFLFVASLQVTQPLKLSTLPTLLLLATLVRLCLNISTTRAILTTGHAGQTVEVFGRVVIQGDIVVGLILFSLVTLVQFLVVAKGAERVAEVAARFTLDALPGKQMAIDAELRSGLIDGESARKKRSDLQVESRYYGALDGAMKFVKGDAIAGIVIVLVNVVGGFLVGVLGKGLDLSTALSTYTTLSIGDGLLSQIPSFLNAVAAGLVVTRVQGDEDSPLATEVLDQMKRLREARGLVAIGAILLAFIPGMPWMLLLSGAIASLLSLALPSSEKRTPAPKRNSSFAPARIAVLEVQVPRDQVKVLGDIELLPQALDQFRESVFKETGILLARPEISLREGESERLAFMIRGLTIYERASEELQTQDLDGVFYQMKAIVLEHAAEFVDDIMTRQLLELLEREFPDVVAAIVPTLVTTTQLTVLLRSLAAESIPIKQLDVILQAIAENDPRLGPRGALSSVRTALRRVVTQRYAPEMILKAHLLDPLLDGVFVRSETEPTLLNTDVVARVLEGARSADVKLVVASRRARPVLFELFQAGAIDANVVAFEEFLPEVRFECLGQIGGKDVASTDELVGRLAA